MKIKDLKGSNRKLFNAISRGLYLDLNKGYRMYDSRLINGDEYLELTIDELLDLFTETEIRKWRGMGNASYELLLSLRG